MVAPKSLIDTRSCVTVSCVTFVFVYRWSVRKLNRRKSCFLPTWRKHGQQDGVHTVSCSCWILEQWPAAVRPPRQLPPRFVTPPIRFRWRRPACRWPPPPGTAFPWSPSRRQRHSITLPHSMTWRGARGSSQRRPRSGPSPDRPRPLRTAWTISWPSKVSTSRRFTRICPPVCRCKQLRHLFRPQHLNVHSTSIHFYYIMNQTTEYEDFAEEKVKYSTVSARCSF